MDRRVVLHIDMNAYFASIEQKANRLLRGKPVAVVADSRRRSVVMTASYEARAFGVRTGMNLYEARRLCPHVIAVDGNSDKYLDCTRRILALLETFTDQVEMRSCDEAYLDVTGSQACFRTDGAGIGRLLMRKVEAALGLSCSVGVAPNKSLAKLASDRKKPNGLTVVDPERVVEFLAGTRVEDLCGVGERWKQKLNGLGIRTCAQLGAADDERMRHHFGFWGYWLKRMGQGLDDAPVRRLSETESPKSMGHSMTFPRDTEDMEVLQSYLLFLCEKAAFRLRQGGFQGRTVSLYVRYADFSGFGRQKAVGEFLDDGYKIYCAALGLLRQAQPFPLAVRLLSVSVSTLVPAVVQDFLFESMGKRRAVHRAVDDINREFGEFTVKPARLVSAQKSGILHAPIPPSVRSRL